MEILVASKMNINPFLKYGMIISVILIICILAFGLQSNTKPALLSSAQLNRIVKAAESGDGVACWALYLYYFAKDEKASAIWLRKAAEYGYAQAQTSLASELVYKGSEGRLKALELLKKAADQDYAGAQGELGKWYWDGIFVSQDLAEAEYWIKRAASNGSIWDMEELAKLLVSTHQTYAAFVEAYKWTVIALMRANEPSGYSRSAKEIQEEILQRAKKLSFNMDKIKRDAESQAVKLEKQIPATLKSAVEEQALFWQEIENKYRD